MEQYRKTYIEIYGKYYKDIYGVNLCDAEIVIHHIDHDRDNNAIENLVAIPRELHNLYHQLWNEMFRNEFHVPDRMIGRYVNTSSYIMQVAKEYISCLDQCAVWVHTKDMINFRMLKGEG